MSEEVQELPEMPQELAEIGVGVVREDRAAVPRKAVPAGEREGFRRGQATLEMKVELNLGFAVEREAQ